MRASHAALSNLLLGVIVVQAVVVRTISFLRRQSEIPAGGAALHTFHTASDCNVTSTHACSCGTVEASVQAAQLFYEAVGDVVHPAFLFQFTEFWTIALATLGMYYMAREVKTGPSTVSKKQLRTLSAEVCGLSAAACYAPAMDMANVERGVSVSCIVIWACFLLFRAQNTVRALAVMLPSFLKIVCVS
jgi:hypothetical protein